MISPLRISSVVSFAVVWALWFILDIPMVALRVKSRIAAFAPIETALVMTPTA